MPYMLPARSRGRMGLVLPPGRVFVGDGPAGSLPQSQMIVRGPVTYTPPAPLPSASTPVILPQPVYNPNPFTFTPPTPVASAPAPTSSSPVPPGYPTNQIFVASDGSFWEWSPTQAAWMNVGTPYNTGAANVPPVTPGTMPSAPTAAPASTVAPAPVSTVNIASPSGTYQEILDWLQEDTLGSTIGFASIPNWLIVLGAGALAWKFSRGGGRSRNPRRRRRGSR